MTQTEIRPFRIDVPHADLDDLRELVTDIREFFRSLLTSS
jgi:hypothetical protein